MVHCSGCGKPLAEEDNFCRRCGKAVDQQEKNTAVNQGQLVATCPYCDYEFPISEFTAEMLNNRSHPGYQNRMMPGPQSRVRQTSNISPDGRLLRCPKCQKIFNRVG